MAGQNGGRRVARGALADDLRFGAPRRPSATLRQELVLRMAAMARQPALTAFGVRASVVHPADRELGHRCEELGGLPQDTYDAVSMRIVARADDALVGAARVTLWSPVVGFMVEHEVTVPRGALVLGPRTAELSHVVGDGDAVVAPGVFLALVMLAGRVTSVHGVDHLYVVGPPELVASLHALEPSSLAANAARVDLQSQPWERLAS
jgi:hypothetical protein